MAAYTKEELQRISAMRRQARADDERRQSMWTHAQPGHTSSDTNYVIEYRTDDHPTWFAASPFYDPLRVDPDRTHSKEEAEEVAALILLGTWGVAKQSDPGAVNVTAVRVIKGTWTSKIVQQLDR